MKERKGPIGEVVGGIAGSIAQTVRRRQQDREPRVMLYDDAGMPRVLPHGAPGRDDLVATAGRLIELANGGAAPPAPGADDEDAAPPTAHEEAG